MRLAWIVLLEPTIGRFFVGEDLEMIENSEIGSSLDCGLNAPALQKKNRRKATA